MSQSIPTKFSMPFKHNYSKLFWRLKDHSFNFSFVHGPFWLSVLESIHGYGVIFTFWKKNQKVIVRPCLMSKTLLTLKGICMNFLLELNFFILSHPVTSKQPHKIVQIHMRHPVELVSKEFYHLAAILHVYMPGVWILSKRKGK